MVNILESSILSRKFKLSTKILKGNLYVFLLLILFSCNGEMLESLPTNVEPGGFCPNSRLLQGHCPEDQTDLSWAFENSTEYIFNSNKIEVSNGQASLKQINSFFFDVNFNDGQYLGTQLSNSKISILETPTTESIDVTKILPSKESSLVGYWQFNGNFLDSSPLSNDGTAFGDVFTTTSAKLGTHSGSFDSLGDYLDTGINQSLQAITSLSMCSWLKHNSLSSDNFIISSISSSGGVLFLRDDVGSSSGRTDIYKIFITEDNAFNNVSIESRSDASHGDYWHHVCFTFSADNISGLRLYIDGIEDVNSPVSTLGIHQLNFNNNLYIGSNTSGNGNFDGLMDDVSIWKDVLTSNQIRALYEQQNSAMNELSATWTPYWDDLIGYWKMNANWLDSSGKENHGTANADLSFSSDSKIGDLSGSFDGTGDYMSLSSIDLSTMTEGTLSIWAKSSADSLSNNRLLEFGTISERVGIFLDPTQETHLYILKNSSTCLNLTSDIKINDGQWHHIVGTYSSMGARLFIDGKVVASNSSNCSSNLLSSSSKIYIGQYLGGGDYEWEGLLDDASVWSYALSTADINEIYNRQKQKFSGSYLSPIIDIEKIGNWDELKIKTSLPFGKDIVSDQSDQISSYSDISGDLSNALIGYWSFNENSLNSISGDDFEDKSLNSFNANESGAVSLTTGILGQGVAFDGVDDSLSVLNLDLSSTNVITASFWMKWDEENQNDSIILEYSPTFNSSISGFLINANPTGQGGAHRMSFAIRGNGSYNLSNTDRPNDGEWHHYAVIMDKGASAANEVIPYIDGEPVTFNKSHIGENTNNFGNEPLFFMARNGSSFFGEGGLDEVGIWTRALSEVEIKQLYRRAANRIKYQVRSCIDPNCHCKSYSLIPEGTSLDCDGDGIVNSLDHSDSHIAEFIGPGGSGDTYYSELFNRAPIDITSTCDLNTSDNDDDICLSDEIDLLGESLSTAPSFVFNNMAASASILDNQYFQYKVIMEAQENSACAGSACLPELTSVEVTPRERFFTGSPVIKSSIPIKYVDILEMKFSEGGQCNLTYQLSSDGITYYYHDGARWVVAASEVSSLSSNAVVTSKYIASFVETVGSGSLYFKAFMNSDGSQSCVIEEINLRHYY